MWKGLTDMVKRKRTAASKQSAAKSAPAAIAPVPVTSAVVAPPATVPAACATSVAEIPAKIRPNGVAHRLSKPKVQQELLALMARTGAATRSGTTKALIKTDAKVG